MKFFKMTCKICGNTENNKLFILKEMMFGLKDQFEYFQCSYCECLQISEIPENMEKYYPQEYYSFSTEKKLSKSFFKKLQFDQLSGFKKTFAGKAATIKYKSKIYNWFKNLQVKDKDVKLLDVGSGSGDLLITLYTVGFTNLTGIDPYIKKDVVFNKHFRLFKKSVFETTDQYDFIMLHHSLEHMASQQEVVNQLYQLLKNDGKLLIRIPIVSKPLMEKYKENLVSLDAPRHFFIHSVQSISLILKKAGFKIIKTEYDADAFDIIGSEQYEKDISLLSEQSYTVNRKNSIFTKEEIKKFKKEITRLNEEGTSSNIALYIEKILPDVHYAFSLG